MDGWGIKDVNDVDWCGCIGVVVIVVRGCFLVWFVPVVFWIVRCCGGVVFRRGWWW